jgi:hypothetical protein
MDWLGWITNGWRPGSLAWRLRQARWKVFLGLIEHLPRPVRGLDVGGEKGEEEEGGEGGAAGGRDV